MRIEYLLCVVILIVGIFEAAKKEENVLIGLEWRFKLHSISPVKNSSLFKSLGHSYYIDANKVASLASNQTKEEVIFSQAVTSWSNELFLAAECFIPLCRTSPENLIWDEKDDNLFKPSDKADFEACCAVADTRLPEDSQEPEECIVNPLQSCREQIYQAPCGDLVFDSNGRLLEEAICGATARMEVDARFFELENSEICCLQCACFGDPRCVSFDGSSDIWVLCDGRGPKNSDDPDSRCVVQQDICTTQLDHEDRSCQWIDLTPAEEEVWTILSNGSQCIPNDLSGDSWIIMYEFDEFGLEVKQINRGIIDAVELRLFDEVFALEAADCDKADFNASWTFEGEFISPPESFVQVVEEVDVDYKEIVWAVSQTETAMHVRLRCLRQRDLKGNKSPPRIHIEALVEPEANLEGRRNTNGFCINNEFDQTGSTELTEEIENGEGCTAADISKLEQVRIARALCGDSIVFGNIASCLVSFCEENFFPSFLDSMECVVAFGDGVEGFEFRDTFCKAMTFVEEDMELCIVEWDSLGALETINKYYLNTNPPDLKESCAEGIEDLPKELGECEAGVSLQFLNEELEWVTFISIPERRPPCGNLEFNILEHREIFINPIRWQQCTIPSNCITATNTLCRTQTRFLSDVILRPAGDPNDGVVVTSVPTEIPTTLTPTTNPTSSPTAFPTLFPSESPSTSAPTEFPTETFETEFPTESPTTVAPTSFPTESPTERERTETPSDSTETNFPSESPTNSLETSFPSESPSEAPTEATRPCSKCTSKPTENPVESPTNNPTVDPTSFPTLNPTTSPTKFPSMFPTVFPTEFPSNFPTLSPTTPEPTESPTLAPSLKPTLIPTVFPSSNPTESPTENPTVNPTSFPTRNPTVSPTLNPTTSPTSFPTAAPTNFPSTNPSKAPSESPTLLPTLDPTLNPTASPIETPTESPTLLPTNEPTGSPTPFPSESPTESPTEFPTSSPTCNPTKFPTGSPTESPSTLPTVFPTELPTVSPTVFPTEFPTESPTLVPTESPTIHPTSSPTFSPTETEIDCDCNEFLVQGVRAKKISGKQASFTESISSEKKLQFQNAGELVFYAMYKSEDAAEKELLLNDAHKTLSRINEAFKSEGFEVVASSCELSLLVSQVEEPVSEGGNDSQLEPVWEFFDIESNFLTLTVMAGLLILAAALAIVLVAASIKGKVAATKEAPLINVEI